MLWTIAIVLLVLWLLGVFLFKAVGAVIHILLLVAVIVILYRIVKGRRVV